MIKICHVTSAHNNTDVRIFEKECVSLAKNNNYAVYLVASGESYTKKSVTVIGVGAKPNSRKDRMFSFAKKVVQKALELNADIYHLHDPELLQFVDLLKRNNKIVIFDQHENVAGSILDKTYIPKYLRKFVAFTYEKYSQNIIKKCDAIISVTPHIIERLRIIHHNVYMVTNYPLYGREIGSCPKNKNVHTMIFAGGISEQWSHELVINVLDELDDVRYELYGIARSGYLLKLQQMPGWRNVSYHGKVPFQEVQNALQNAGIAVALLQPNNNTCGMIGTLGNTKLFESMAAGLPVICTNFVLWKNIIDKYHCGICINPNSGIELKQAIEYLLNNPLAAAEMGNNGKRAIEVEFNWSTQEKVLFGLYNDILQNRTS